MIFSNMIQSSNFYACEERCRQIRLSMNFLKDSIFFNQFLASGNLSYENQT